MFKLDLISLDRCNNSINNYVNLFHELRQQLSKRELCPKSQWLVLILQSLGEVGRSLSQSSIANKWSIDEILKQASAFHVYQYCVCVI